MAVFLDAVPFSTTQNSYTDLVFAEEYFASRLNSTAWNGASDDEKAMSLITGTRILEQSMDWIGWITNQSQVLRWPRNGVVDRDDRVVDSQAVPIIVQQATCEMALWILNSGDLYEVNDLVGAGITSAKVGPISVDIDVSKSNLLHKEVIPPHVLTMLIGYGQIASIGSGNGRSAKLERV